MPGGTNRLDRLDEKVESLRADIAKVLEVATETRDHQLRHDPAKAEEERKAQAEKIQELERWRSHQTGRGQLLQWLVAAIAGFVSGMWGGAR